MKFEGKQLYSRTGADISDGTRTNSCQVFIELSVLTSTNVRNMALTWKFLRHYDRNMQNYSSIVGTDKHTHQALSWNTAHPAHMRINANTHTHSSTSTDTRLNIRPKVTNPLISITTITAVYSLG